jgi:hypothetical protein
LEAASLTLNVSLLDLVKVITERPEESETDKLSFPVRVNAEALTPPSETAKESDEDREPA